MTDSKQKQAVSAESFIPESIAEGSTPDINDDKYWAGFDPTNVAPVSKSESESNVERLQNIEKLYPHFERKQIPLDKLVPALEEWNFFPAQRKEAVEELMKNIVAYGQLSPALVWEQVNGTYMILGGHTRFQALQELHDIFMQADDKEQAERFAYMDCNTYAHDELDETEARKIIIFDNVIRRENTTAIKAQAVINMNRLERASREKRVQGTQRERILSKVAKALGETEGTVKDLYRLRRLEPEFWKLVDSRKDEDKITVQFARTIAVLPNTLQHYIYEQQLYKKKLSPTQMKELRNASSQEDINKVYSMPQPFILSASVELPNAPSKECEAIALVIPKDELLAVKKAILEGVSSSPDVSEMAQELIVSILKE